jgi:hypothetical protein
LAMQEELNNFKRNEV